MSSYTFDDWKAAVDRSLTQRKRGVQTSQLDDAAMHAAFTSGISPVMFAAQATLPPKPVPVAAPPPPDPAIVARARQAAQVLQDPRYIVDTGYNVGCPGCGSTNVVPVGKPGTGLGVIGSLGFVLAATVVEAAIQSKQKMVFQCSYCNTKFS